MSRSSRGRFITFEGGEGSGKSTQAELLANALRRQGQTVLVTREPGGDPVAERIRAVVLAADSPVVPRAELMLFLAARAQLVEQVIRPALEAGVAVICDRFGDSTVVYQGHARGLPLEDVRNLVKFATNGLDPDLTILLDINPEVGLGRQSDRNRMELAGLEFHQRVRNGYIEEAKVYARIQTVAAERDVEVIHRDILATVASHLQHSAMEECE